MPWLVRAWPLDKTTCQFSSEPYKNVLHITLPHLGRIKLLFIFIQALNKLLVEKIDVVVVAKFEHSGY